MVGNDVVDLSDQDADLTTYRPGFDARVFSTCEQESLHEAATPARQRWRLWAAKEASYKLARKFSSSTRFSPRSFVVRLLSGSGSGARCRGIVEHLGREYRVEVRDGDGWIHAVAIPGAERFSDLMVGVQRLVVAGSAQIMNPEQQSQAVRALACARLAARLGLSKAALRIEKEGRIPVLWHAGRRMPVSLSLSHHGALVAFASRVREATS